MLNITPLVMLVTSFVVATAAQAQQFPERPIRIIVALTPGTGPDNIARQVGEKFLPRMGQPAVVENRPGLSGHLGAELVSRAPADGHTILMTTSSLAVTATLHAADFPKFNAITDLAPLTKAAYGASALVASNKSPFRTFSELLAFAKANPGKLSFGTPGIGHPFHFQLEALQDEFGISFLHVPYKGTGPAMSDLIAGHVDVMLLSTHTILPFITRGQVKGIASASKDRHRIAPNLPAYSELGITVPGGGWFGFLAPAAVPVPILNKLSSEIRAILRLPDVKAALEKTGLEVNPSTPEEMLATIKEEFVEMARAIKKYNIKP